MSIRGCEVPKSLTQEPAAWFPDEVPHRWFVFYGDPVYERNNSFVETVMTAYYIWCMNPIWLDQFGHPEEVELDYGIL